MPNESDLPTVDEQLAGGFCPYCGQPLTAGYDTEQHPPDGW